MHVKQIVFESCSVFTFKIILFPNRLFICINIKLLIKTFYQINSKTNYFLNQPFMTKKCFNFIYILIK